MSKLFSSTAAGLTVLSLASSLWASPANKVISEYKRAKSQMVEADEKQRQILAAIYNINKHLKKAGAENSALEAEKMVAESNVRDLAERILQLTEKTKEQKSLLRERLVAIYKLGGPGVTRFLLSSQNSAELDRNLKILGKIAVQDLDLIKDYNQTTAELSQKQTKFTARLKTLKNLEEKLREREQSLAQENARKEKILSELRRTQSKSMARLLKLREKSQRSLAASSTDADKDLLALLGPAFFEQKGRLPSPIRAPIRQNFGLMKDDVHQVALSHKGVFFAAPPGSPVAAIFHGTVAFADELPGFGRTVIIDHGDHYYTVYGDNRELKVTVGDSVKQNQTIALSGISPENSGSGLYFEVRHFSEPTDPRSWMKGPL
jgi:septal ring factor EnvC (AmiA/AmiB activator)